MRSHNNPHRKGVAVAALGALGAALAGAASAEVTGFEILETTSPAFDGGTFGDVGAYEMIVARAHGELDPSDPHNAVIADIELAPTNAEGMVEYSTDVQILKPVDPSASNDRLLFEVLNRGRKLALGAFNDAPGTNEPATAEDAGSGFLFERGYIVAWAGWQSPYNVSDSGGRMRADIPIAQGENGEPITQRVIFETIFDDTDSTDISLLFPAADPESGDATVLVRNSSDGERTEVPREAYTFIDAHTVQLDRSRPFFDDYDAGAAYEVIYTARDPDVSGIGFAITRDVASFLRFDESEMNPIAGEVRYALGQGTSQSGRMLKGFIQDGFNEDEAGRMVFDGINVNISGAHAMALNERFGDANATGRAYERHTIGRIAFPFTYDVTTDPVSGETGGIFGLCRETETCPKVMHTDSGNEAWGKAAMLVTTDGMGHDIPLPEDVRYYYFAGTQHGADEVPERGICQQLSNPNPWEPHLRALLVALNGWATAGIAPPDSVYPRVGDGTLAPSLPQSLLGFPEIPGVTYNGLINQVAVLDDSELPNVPVAGKEYVVLAPRTDADGNDLAGIRSVQVQVPTATYTGWSLRAEGFAEGEECVLAGQYIPFAQTRAEREASGDPRLSIEERYGSHGNYLRKVANAAEDLVNERFLLPEDADAIVAEAAASDVATGE